MLGWAGRLTMPALYHLPGSARSRARCLARHEPDRRAAMRLLAIAHALDGFSRAEAARLARMERQALHDAVRRYNAEGPQRPATGPARRPEGLTPRATGGTQGLCCAPSPERTR